MNEHEARLQIIDVCRRLHGRQWLAGADGNVSVRLDAEHLLITPTGRAKARLAPTDLAVMTLNGETLAGEPSSERSMHLAVFRHCAVAQAVVHAHPPSAIAWSIARPDLTELPADCVSEVILAVGRIPFVPYARPGSSAMGENLAPFLPQHRVMVLARHGALSWGETLEEAYIGMERLEHSAEILRRAASLGPLTSLPLDEIEALRALRRELGDQSR